MSDGAWELAMIRADDELLDRLGAGGSPSPEEGHEVSALLAAWRADIASGAPAIVRPAAPAAGERRRGAAVASRPGRPSARTRVLLGAAAALIALAGTVSVLASDARPGSPLWPVTRLLYADRADSAVAEQDAQRAIDGARQSIDDSQYSDAQAKLDEATALVDRVRDPSVAQRLREQIAALRALLPGLLGPPATTAPGAGSPSATSTPGGGLLPTAILPPLPSLGLPLPSSTCIVPLPTGLPLNLPLPTCVVPLP